MEQRKRPCWILLTVFSVSVIAIFLSGYYISVMDGNPLPIAISNVVHELKSTHIMPKVTLNKTRNGSRIVLAYTPFFGDWTYGHQGSGNNAFIKNKCRYTNCIFTHDKSKTDIADVVFFHCRDGLSSFPKVRHPHQIYTIFCLESPRHSSFNKFRNIVNATATYRLDSDIHTPYMKIFSRQKPLKGDYVRKYYNKTNAAVWPVSNCVTPSKRHLYIRELSKHYKVDIYGACGPKKCARSQDAKCREKFQREYKFYLSFENSICTGYVTEKFFVPLMLEVIPVVYGDANYSHIAPRHSYIDTADFKTPKHLADYLKYLSNNDTAYNEYFAWKQNYTVGSDLFGNLFCKFCEMINEQNFHRPAWDVASWWSAPGVCKGNYVNKFLH